MKRMVVICIVVLTTPVLLLSQISVTVLGTATGGSMTSGDLLSWQITLPTGATVDNELWVDVNGNSVLENGTDVLIFRFSQKDGGQFSDGPGDDDTTANGVITTTFAAGLAPAAWMFVVAHSSGSDTSAFTVLPLTSPAATITGNVTVPSGYSREYRLVEASLDSDNNSGVPDFWQGLTNASGDYTIAMGGDPASKNPWRVRLDDGGMTGLLVAVRRDTSVNVGPVAPVVNFELIGGTSLSGSVREAGTNNPIELAEIHTHPGPPGTPDTGDNFGTRTRSDGTYEFIVPPGNYLLHFVIDGYLEQWWDNVTDNQSATTIAVTTQDSIKNLDALLTPGGRIQGQVRYDGVGVRANVILLGSDSIQIQDQNTEDDGTYSITVQPGSYYMKFEHNGSFLYYDQKTSLPGDLITITGAETVADIDADFVTPTSVERVEEIPTAFTLNHNYPNPFNPSTTLSYDVPADVYVRIVVYNALGEIVATIVEAMRPAGAYSATFDATALPSGLYFARMQAGEFTAVQKMSLIK